MENHVTFISELKNLQACSLSTFGASLKEAFDLLNVRRLQTGIDHYGQVCVCVYTKLEYYYIMFVCVRSVCDVFSHTQGRNPFFLEPAVVIALTDGGKLTNSAAVDQEVCTCGIY